MTATFDRQNMELYAREHLNLSTDCDAFVLINMVDAAEAWVSGYIGKPVAGIDPFPADIKHAMLQLVAHWYENREATFVGAAPELVPFGVHALLERHKERVF